MGYTILWGCARNFSTGLFSDMKFQDWVENEEFI